MRALDDERRSRDALGHGRAGVPLLEGLGRRERAVHLVERSLAEPLVAALVEDEPGEDRWLARGQSGSPPPPRPPSVGRGRRGRSSLPPRAGGSAWGGRRAARHASAAAAPPARSGARPAARRRRSSPAWSDHRGQAVWPRGRPVTSRRCSSRSARYEPNTNSRAQTSRISRSAAATSSSSGCPASTASKAITPRRLRDRPRDELHHVDRSIRQWLDRARERARLVVGDERERRAPGALTAIEADVWRECDETRVRLRVVADVRRQHDQGVELRGSLARNRDDMRICHRGDVGSSVGRRGRRSDVRMGK